MSKKITFVSTDQTQNHQSINHDVSPMKHDVYDLGERTSRWRSAEIKNIKADTSDFSTEVTTVDLTSTGTITAVTINASGVISGDGSGLTNLPASGTNKSIQYNNSGSTDGSNLFTFDPSTNHVSIGTTNTLATLQVHDAASPNPLSDLGDPALYQLGLSGATFSNTGIGIAFGDRNNVGAGIVFDDLGTQAQGNLRFYTKASVNQGDAPQEVLTLKYDGNVGVGVPNPLSQFEVNKSIGLAYTNSSAGEMKFRLTTNTPTANALAGSVNFGTNSYTQATVQSIVDSDWRLFSDPLGVSRETSLSFKITKENQSGMSEMLRLNTSGSNFYSDVDITGTLTVSGNIQGTDITATGYFIGDGSQLTNLPITSPGGSTGQVQFKLANNTFGGASNIHFNDTTGQTVFSNTTDYQGYVTISKDLGTDVNTNPNDMANNHLVLKHKGTEGTGKGVGLAFGTDNGVTGQIASILNSSGNAEGGLVVKVKNNNTLNGTLDTSLFISDNFVSYTPSVFEDMLLGRNNIISNNNVDPDEDGVDFQFQAMSGDANSAGISFGNTTKAGAGILGIPWSGSLSTADIAFKTRNNVNNAMNTNMYIQASTNRVGVNTVTPLDTFDVNGSVRTNELNMYSSGFSDINFLTGSNVPVAGQVLGQIYGKQQSLIRFNTLSTWNASNKSTGVSLWTTPINSTIMSMTAYFTSSTSYIYSNILTIAGLLDANNGLDVTGDSLFRNHVEVNSTDGLEVIGGPLTAPRVETGEIYANSIAYSQARPYIDTTYYSGSTQKYTSVSLKNIRYFNVYNDDNSHRPIRLDIASHDKGKLYLCSHVGASLTSYSLSNKQNSHGVYHEGESSGTYSSTTASFTFVNTTGMNTPGFNQGSHHQVAIDVIAGRGIEDQYSSSEGTTTRRYNPTSDTKFFRFYAPYKGSTLSNDFGDIENFAPIRVGRIYGDGNGGIVYAQSFTGTHATIIDKDTKLEVGMVVGSSGTMWHGEGVSTALPKVKILDTPMNKTAFGVISNLEGGFEGYVSASPPKETEQHIEVNSIGEGRILVTDFGGNIENGDYITSSAIRGFGVKQEDDLLHNYTIAKCTESINWEAVTDKVEHEGVFYKRYLVSCTYHCG